MTKSNMPQGTRLAALLALCLAACLLAWRGNTLLIEDPSASVAATPELARVTSLLEPVLGRGTTRIVAHTAPDGARTWLILVDTPTARFDLDSETTGRISAILSAATGFDPARDSLQIQPFAFAPGTAGGLDQAALIELAILASLCALTGYFVLASTRTQQPAAPASAAPSAHRTGEPPVLRAVPMPDRTAPEDSRASAQRLARENPKETASILRSWMSEGTTS